MKANPRHPVYTRVGARVPSQDAIQKFALHRGCAHTRSRGAKGEAESLITSSGAKEDGGEKNNNNNSNETKTKSKEQRQEGKRERSVDHVPATGTKDK